MPEITEIDSLTNAIGRAMPDEYPVAFARHLATEALEKRDAGDTFTDSVGHLFVKVGDITIPVNALADA